MFRHWKAPVIATLALGTVFATAPKADAAWRGGWGGGWGGPRVGIGVGVGPGWYGGWGPGWWGPYGYYYGSYDGKVKIETPNKDAAVYIDGGYIGTAESAKSFPLAPGTHAVEVRAPNGQIMFNQNVQVLSGHTTKLHVG
jgi:hypothetical protein